MTNANLTDAILKGADLDGSSLAGANLTNADLTNASIGQTEFSGANFIPIQLYSTANYKVKYPNKIVLIGNNPAGFELRRSKPQGGTTSLPPR